MGKAKKSKLKASGQQPYQGSNKRISKPTRPLQKSKPTKTPQAPAPTIPFSSSDRILLVGEGDFSFSRSLLETHGCASLIVTSFDKQSALQSKYPQSTSNVRALEEEEECQVLFGVDATKLGRPGAFDGGRKEVRKGNFDRVIFNFPHVGGLTKDVNRQVRYNQGKSQIAVKGFCSTTRGLTHFQSFSLGSSNRHCLCWRLKVPSSLQYSRASRIACGISEILPGTLA